MMAQWAKIYMSIMTVTKSWVVTQLLQLKSYRSSFSVSLIPSSNHGERNMRNPYTDKLLYCLAGQHCRWLYKGGLSRCRRTREGLRIHRCIPSSQKKSSQKPGMRTKQSLPFFLNNSHRPLNYVSPCCWCTICCFIRSQWFRIGHGIKNPSKKEGVAITVTPTSPLPLKSTCR